LVVAFGRRDSVRSHNSPKVTIDKKAIASGNAALPCFHRRRARRALLTRLLQEAIEGLEVFGVPSFVGQRATGVPGNVVRESDQAAVAPQIADVRPTEMPGTE
jgi:hypothetical protein